MGNTFGEISSKKAHTKVYAMLINHAEPIKEHGKYQNRTNEQLKRAIAHYNALKKEGWYFAEDFSLLWARNKISTRMKELALLDHIEYNGSIELMDRRNNTKSRYKAAIRFKKDIGSAKRIFADFIHLGKIKEFMASDYYRGCLSIRKVVLKFNKELPGSMLNRGVVAFYERAGVKYTLLDSTDGVLIIKVKPELFLLFLDNKKRFRELVHDLYAEKNIHTLFQSLVLSDVTTKYIDSLMPKEGRSKDKANAAFKKKALLDFNNQVDIFQTDTIYRYKWSIMHDELVQKIKKRRRGEKG